MNEAASIPERPVRRADVVLRKLGADAMLYDPAADQVVRLNPTSQRIWELCDGEHDLSRITAALRGEFEVAPDVALESDVRRTLAAFVQAGLLAA